jgi:hypothetical protein
MTSELANLTRTPASVAAILLLSAMTTSVALPLPDPEAEALRSFQDRVAGYMALHHRLEASIAPVARPTDAVNLYAMPTALRHQLQRARAGTQEGRVFAPPAANIFKRLIAQTVGGDYARLLKATHEDADELGRALVNDQWPGPAVTTMPPDLLNVFPRLPPELEYRFVHRDMVLWDAAADLIVDVLRDAIPLESRGTTTSMDASCTGVGPEPRAD